ncbi:cupin domain-containing protein [Flavisolibacter ginsenosidimutans]|uniref:Cupin domain-containing protein n=1 Tax=Flavisolibacter ginsenosidimutans TaxID=661481 RepID=A0A5B8UEI4_9BACT|nr:cupin domain-containing protein [Flavisolibacter ginsenosidimutans]QEC54529.1 cupin domain-containing protein [Flavisolibacter ginsenosidimutans]
MPTRKIFLKTMGIMSSLFMVPEAFANREKEEAQLTPMLANRNKENSYWYIGHLMSLLVTSKDTNGRYALLRATERRGLEPPPHTHTKEDEAFLILEGEVVYTVGNQTFHAKEGDLMFLPKNIQHSFKIQSEKLETLILLTPGGLENYFVEMSNPAEKLQLPPMPQGPPDIKKLVATASKYGVKFPKM